MSNKKVIIILSIFLISFFVGVMAAEGPFVVGDRSITTDEDTAFTITLNSTGVENVAVTYAVETSPSYGTASISGDQAKYTPSLNYNGPDSFTYYATDGSNRSNTATVSITVNPVNDPPVADSKSVTTNEDTAVGVTLTAKDPENDPLTYSIISNPSHGTLSGTPPDLVYTPASNYNGPDSFTYKATDNHSVDSNIATVSITVNPVNDPPSIPVKIYPINWMNFTDGNIRLTWSASTDADGDNLTYDWELSNKSDFSITLKSENTESLSVDLSLPPDAYYWRVRANDSFNKSAWSQSATPDFQVVSAPSIDNVRALIISNSSIKVMWAANQNDLNIVRYGYKPSLEDGIWSSWNNNTGNPNIIINGLTGQSVYYQVFSYNASNSSAYSNSSILNFVYPLQVTMYYIEPVIINNNESWRPTDTGHIGKFIGFDGYFKNTGEDSLTLSILGDNLCTEPCIVTLAKNDSKSFMESLGRNGFEINSSGINGDVLNSTIQIKVMGQNSSGAFNYTNTTTISLQIIPIFKIKRAYDTKNNKEIGFESLVIVSEGGTTTIKYVLEANSSVNLTNVQICDPFYPKNQGGPCFNIPTGLEANKPENISYTYKATTSDLSSMKCEESIHFGIPCIINQVTFGADIESTDRHIKDTEYLRLLVGTISPQTYTGGSGGSVSSGGGGAPASSEDFNNIEAREVREMAVYAKSASTYVFKSADPVMVVGFESSSSENEVPVVVEVLKNRSKFIGEDAPGKLYKYFNVFVGTSGFSKKVSKGVIAYRVNNSWLKENNIDPADISLYKWRGTWVKLDTEIAENRSNYTYYASLTGNFSSFAIAAAKEQKMGGAYASIPDIPEAPVEQQNTTRAMANLSGDGPKHKIPGLSAVAILVFGIAGIIFHLKRNHKKFNKDVRK